jgi:hypothetical protein
MSMRLGRALVVGLMGCLLLAGCDLAPVDEGTGTPDTDAGSPGDAGDQAGGAEDAPADDQSAEDPPAQDPPVEDPPVEESGESSGSDGGNDAGDDQPAGEFPDASNTGVPSGTNLQKSGSIKVTRDGAVVDGKDVSGQITVAADNVTIRRSRVRTNGAKYAIRVEPDTRGTLVEDVDLIGTDNKASVGIVFGNYTVQRANIRGFVDGPRLGSNTTVEDSYVHDTRKFSGTHNDAVQALGGSNIKLIGNTLEGPWRTSTSAALLSANWSPLRNVVIRGNKLSGGGYTLYIQRKDGAGQPAPSKIVVEDNVWVKNSWAFGPHTIASGADVQWRNNRLSTGEKLTR